MPGAKLLGALLAACCTTSVLADSVVCHLTYGGATQQIETRPTASAYTVKPVAIGSYFLFRVVFRDQPADLAGIKLYTYANRDEGPAILHQASYPYPLDNAASGGFTGENRIYEPLRDGELLYWCELKRGAEK